MVIEKLRGISGCLQMHAWSGQVTARNGAAEGASGLTRRCAGAAGGSAELERLLSEQARASGPLMVGW